MRRLRLVMTVTALLASSRANGWDAQIIGNGVGRGIANAVATTADGDVIATGLLSESDGTRIVVVRLHGLTGAERWRTVIATTEVAPPTTDAMASTIVRVDDVGDVVAAAESLASIAGFGLVAKIAGDTGIVRWRHDLGPGTPVGLVTDDANDVYVAGSEGLTVTKLAAGTGEERWTFAHDGYATGLAQTVDQDPVVVGASQTDPPATPVTGTVVRLDRATGRPVWTRSLETKDGVPSRILTMGTDVIIGANAVAIPFPPLFSVRGVALALAAATGEVEWSRALVVGGVDALAPARSDEVAVVGLDLIQERYSPARTTNLHVIVLRKADGAILAEHTLPPRGEAACLDCSSQALIAGMVADSSGDVSVVGSFRMIELVAARLGAGDLHEIWRRDGGGSASVPGSFMPEGAARTAGGALVIAGVRRPTTATVDAFTVLTLDLATGAPHACGDGTTDAGEACDDANRLDDDCCTSDCRAAPDGTTCADGSLCTVGDRCNRGICGVPLPCEPCGQCHPETGCFVETSNACGQSTITRGARITIMHPRRGDDRFTWTLRKGPATTKYDFGNPFDATSYAVCASLPNGRVVLRAAASAGTCGRRRSCWRSTRTGFEYANPSAPDGLARLSLRAGRTGKARFHAEGAGKEILREPLPLAGQLRVEFRRVDEPTTCWSAEMANVTETGTRRFRATGR